MPQSEEEIVSDEMRETVDAIVRDPPWFLVVPSELTAAFERRRAQTFARLVGPGSPFVLILTFAIALAGLPFFDLRLETYDGKVWWGAEAITLSVSVVGLFLVRVPKVVERYVLLVSVGSSIVLASKLFQTLAFHDPAMVSYATHVCAVTTNLIMLAFRMPPTVSVLTCAGGAVAAVTAALTLGIPIPLDKFPFFLLASSVVSFGVAHFAERQERLAFLQSVLLAHESARSHRLNEVLAQIARTDPLTGIANRRHFDAQLALEWDRARRTGDDVALLFVDVDHFKSFNDTYGHPAGDACLASVAQALAGVARRPADLVARYGGEEFVLLLPGTDLAGGKKLAAVVIDAVDRLQIPHVSSQAGKHVTVSVGVSAMRPQQDPGAPVASDEHALVRAADENLYRAKSEGRHRASWAPVAPTTGPFAVPS